MTYSKSMFFALGGLIVVALFVLFGGDLVPSSDPRIVIEWGVDPGTFQSAGVEIDGVLVGTLEAPGQSTRNAFQVEQGRHTVRIVHPEFPCQPRLVDLPLRANNVFVVLDLEQISLPGGQTQWTIVFR